MAIKGYNGSVTIGATAVASVKVFSLSVTKETADTTTFDASGWTENDSTLKSWSGSVTVLFDATDAGQDALVDGLDSGTTVAVSLVVNSGGGTAERTYSGDAHVTSMPISSDVNSLVEVSFDFQGTGALTTTAGI